MRKPWNMRESFAMRPLNQSFKTASLHASSASSERFSDDMQRSLRNEITANNGAAANCSGVSRRVLSASGASATFVARSFVPPLGTRRATPPQSLSLESLAVIRRTV